MKALVTGFEPFLDVDDNPSWTIVAGLPATLTQAAWALSPSAVEPALAADALPQGRPPTEVAIVTARLPVTYLGAREALEAAWRVHTPELLVLTGVARGGACRLEARAGQRITSEHPDNAGRCLAGERLGPADRRTSRDVASLVAGLTEAGHRVALSDDCGGYVCNSTYYAALGLDAGAVFVHVPNLLDPCAIAEGRALLLALLGELALRPYPAQGPS